MLAAGSMGAFAQGTVNFNDHVVGTFIIHIWGPQGGTTPVQGNTGSDTPTGTTVYSGSMVGGSGSGTGLANGKDITVELYGAPGNVSGTGLSGLSPLTQYTTTVSTKSTGIGTFLGIAPAGDPGIANTGDKTTAGACLGATVAIAAWYNGGGDTSYSMASTDAAGVFGYSARTYIQTLGGYIPSGGIFPATAPALSGITSFSLVTSTPEPSTIALGVIGAASFLIRRRFERARMKAWFTDGSMEAKKVGLLA